MYSIHFGLITILIFFLQDGVPQEVTVNSMPAPNNSENLSGSNRPLGASNKLPKLKNKLDKRVLITKDSNEAAILAKAAARVQNSNAQMNGEQ